MHTVEEMSRGADSVRTVEEGSRGAGSVCTVEKEAILTGTGQSLPVWGTSNTSPLVMILNKHHCQIEETCPLLCALYPVKCLW